MSKARLIITAVVLEGRTQTEPATTAHWSPGHGLAGHTWQLHSMEIEPHSDAVLDNPGQPVVDTVEQPVEL